METWILFFGEGEVEGRGDGCVTVVREYFLSVRKCGNRFHDNSPPSPQKKKAFSPPICLPSSFFPLSFFFVSFTLAFFFLTNEYIVAVAQISFRKTNTRSKERFYLLSGGAAYVI